MADKCKSNESEVQTTTVWSFPVRGTWATHNNKYRGNFAPQLARNVIETYSEPGEVILDPMAGGGTTLIEAKLLGRGFIGGDINPVAVKLCEQATAFEIDNDSTQPRVQQSCTPYTLNAIRCPLKRLCVPMRGICRFWAPAAWI